MSHFSVLITNTNNFPEEDQLAPFETSDSASPEYLEKNYIFKPDEYGKYLQESIERAHDEDGKLKSWASQKAIDTMKNLIGKPKELQAEFIAQEEYCEFDENGVYSLDNPDAQWDWWVVGGRFAGFFQTKGGGRRGENGVFNSCSTENGVDVIKVKDIDWAAMDTEVKKSRAEEYDNKETMPWVERRVRDMTREEYINRPILHRTYAVIHDGEWISLGWPMSDEEAHTRFMEVVNSLDPETQVTLVDCHM